MSGSHSVLSPSSAVRRIICAGSLAACKGIPDVPTVYAADGTATHTIGSECLTNNTQADEYIGRTLEADGFKFKVDADRAERAQTYIDRMRARVGRRMVEVRLDTSRVVGVPGQGGTGDCVVMNRAARQVEAHDLKDGQNMVHAWEDPGEGLPRWRGANPQLMEYLAAALELADLLGDFDSGLIAIHQPKIGWHDEAVFTRAEIEAWVAWARPREQLAYRLWESGTPEEIRANLTPHEKACKYCPIRGECPARANQVMDMFPVTVEPANVPLAKKPMHMLSEADIAYALERVDEISAWCRDIQAEALRRALAQRAIPGWKVVTGREGARSWTDEDVASQMCTALDAEVKYAPTKLKTPTQMETALKKLHKETWAALQPLIERKPGSPSLVRDHDGRAPLQLGGGVEFGLVPVGTTGAEDLL